jgi:D-arabinose 1-dehydrogenase-like Zn-dependent alcohol dehydrogenase
MATMLAAVLKDFDVLALEEIPRPEPRKIGEVVVAIRACGLCQTDYKAIKGIRRNVTFPFIPGHEPSGVVAAVGIVEAAGSIGAVRLIVELRRRGTRWNLFGITTHERFELDGGLTHFLKGRMDASFGTTPLAMAQAIRLMDRGLVDPGQTISYRFPLARIHEAIEVMESSERSKVIVEP